MRKNNVIKSVINKFFVFALTVFMAVTCVLPEVQVNASEDAWTQINNAVENMRTSVTVNTPVPWNWIDLLTLQHGAACITTFSYSRRRNGRTTYYFDYSVNSLSEYNNVKTELDNVANEIIAGIPSDTTGIEKARMIHDWFVTHTVYDHSHSNPNSHNLYGVLHDHLAVCSGFSCAFKYLMNRVGLDCSIVDSDNHAWNQISSDPDIYVDCTWDNYDYASENGQEYIPYLYFAMDDTDLASIESHSIIARTQPAVDSHPEYLAGDSIATVSFDEYNTESITYYCNQMHDLGYNYFTLDFNNNEAYQNAVNNLPYYMYDLSRHINAEYDMYYITDDQLQTFSILIGSGHDMVGTR